MRVRQLLQERSRRNLLLLIDGVRTEAMLLSSVAGITLADFEQLAGLGLIERSGGQPATPAATAAAPVATPAVNAPPGDASLLSYGQLTARLTKLISSELGLRGFMLTLAVEKADGLAEVEQVAARVLNEIEQRKGPAAASRARQQLYGG